MYPTKNRKCAICKKKTEKQFCSNFCKIFNKNGYYENRKKLLTRAGENKLAKLNERFN